MSDLPSLSSNDVQELLQFLYVCPIGLVAFRADGEIRIINPETVKLLVPILGVTDFTNVFSMLDEVWPELADVVGDWPGDAGNIVLDRRVKSRADVGPSLLSLSVKCVTADSFILWLTDVSLAVAAEDALRESESRLRSVFENIDEGYCVCEMILDASGSAIDYRFLEVNARFEESSGLVDPVGRTVKELVPEIEPVWIETYARVAFGGERLRFEQGSDTLDRWFDVFAMPMQRPGRFAVVFKDQTAHHKAELALEDSERRFRSMAEHLPVLVWVHDREGRRTWMNQTYCDYFGVSRASAADQPSLLDHYSNEGAIAASEFAAAIAAREPFHGEVQVRRGDGALRWVESWAHPQFDGAGTYLGHLGTSVDVNDRVVYARHLAEMVESERRTRETEHNIAVVLQRALLPDHLVEHPRLSLSARYSAAGELADVGGDWYDTFEWSGRYVGVVVGDVVGHDIAAATVMGQLRHGVRALAPFLQPRPADVLAAYAHCVRNHGNAFATAGCVIIDTDTGIATYSLAGHPPPLLIQPDGSTVWLDAAPAPPMYEDRVDQYFEASIVMAPGATIVMYSDGLIERRGENLTRGLERLSHLASRQAVIADTDSLAALLVEELTANAVVEDDIVVVCVRWQPASLS